ncbi:hypothetical protein TNCV_2221181 [Trichonephila clavipes]|nr:hypothetical protein TNCV_2221181 [Trichonephila clavipes]
MLNMWEELFDEARQNMRKQHKTWEKYYNRKRREVNIKVNDWVLVQTHFMSDVGTSHQLDTRQGKPPTEGSRQGASVQYDRGRETKTAPSDGNSATERRPVRSRQATAVRPCPYYSASQTFNTGAPLFNHKFYHAPLIH